MPFKEVKAFTVIILLLFSNVVEADERRNNVFDWDLYEKVLDPELCRQQLKYTASNSYLRDQFLDAGMRIPRGVLLGNFVDLGNYFQCLEIKEPFNNNNIEGKYCVINIPTRQGNLFKDLVEVPELNNTSTRANKTPMISSKSENTNVKNLHDTYTKIASDAKVPENFPELNIKLAVCIPKPCSGVLAVDYFYNFTAAGWNYTEQFCRLPNDKPWVAADYVAIGIFSFIGILTLFSTIYDVRHSGKDPEHCNAVYKSFSFYANLQRITIYNPKSGLLECLDGIRVCATIWILVGHTSIIQGFGGALSANMLQSFKYIRTPNALWISASYLSVDSFLVLSGLLLVYVTRERLTRTTLLKNIPIFYLNRLLRMFPILATVVLMQASVLNRITDGPYWEIMADQVNRCRTRWWVTLLYLQNIVDIEETCLPHTWYLVVDVQLHIISPLVLFWVLSKRRHAWKALLISLVISIIGAATYNFIMEFPSIPAMPTRLDEANYYFKYYYFNTLVRSSPFFIGMICGYVLSLCRKRTVNIPKMLVCLMWLFSLAIAATVIYSAYPIVQMDWDNQFVDSIINSFSRPLWALSLSWLIFACVHGYSGPINSFLSHSLWKLPARLTYGIYLFHYQIIILVNGTAIAPQYFNVPHALFSSFGILTITMGLSFITTVLIDAPFSELVRLIIRKYTKKKSHETVQDSFKE